MSLFKRNAKSTARSVLSGMKSSNAASRASSAKGGGKDEELEALKAQLEEEREKRLRAEWRIMYDAGCDGECEECAYYDVCDGDFVDEEEPEPEQLKTEKLEVEKPKAGKPQVEESEVATAQQAEDEGASNVEDSAADAVVDPEEEALCEQERALYAEAAAYYAAGCDGDCDACAYYDYCPAEEEDPDTEELAFGVTQGDVKSFAKGGMDLARETAATMKDLKEASDEFRDLVDVRQWFK